MGRGRRKKRARRDPERPPSQNILFTLVRVCWRSHPRGYSMPLRRPFQAPLSLFSPPPTHLRTHVTKETSSPGTLDPFAPQNHPLSTPQRIHPSENHARLASTLDSKRPVCTRFAYARATRYIYVPCTRGKSPINSGDVLLELEEFDPGGSSSERDPPRGVAESLAGKSTGRDDSLIRFRYGIEVGSNGGDTR